MKFFISAVVGAILGFYAAQRFDVIVVYKDASYAAHDGDMYDYGGNANDYSAEKSKE